MTPEEQQELDRLREENARLREENARLRRQIAIAKDASPVKRPSLIRVLRLAREACMNVARTERGWELSFGKLSRTFRRLTEIWVVFCGGNFLLTDIFPNMNAVAATEMTPPPARKYIMEWPQLRSKPSPAEVKADPVPF